MTTTRSYYILLITMIAFSILIYGLTLNAVLAFMIGFIALELTTSIGNRIAELIIAILEQNRQIEKITYHLKRMADALEADDR